MTLRVGVIGVGAMGSIHAEHLAHRIPGARLEAIAEVVTKRARAASRQLAVSKVYPEASQLIGDPEIDAVVIATTRRLHSGLIASAASAGKHVFCEKPLGSTLKECDMALAEVARAGVKLQIGFHRRFDASFAAAWGAIRRGAIGEPLIMHMTSRDPSPVAGNAGRLPEDLFLETTIHDLDMARYLSGSEIGEVFVMGVGGKRGLEGAVVGLRMSGGIPGTIDNHLRSVYGYDQRVEVFGSRGMVSVENQAPDSARLSDADGIHSARPRAFFAERYAEAYRAELESFVSCVTEGREPAVTGNDGRAAVAAALACAESLSKGRPVSVSYSVPSR
jgi:myo-inositol 2-dehydrogenase/D-chiro-inositol 1-dehydrogenase